MFIQSPRYLLTNADLHFRYSRFLVPVQGHCMLSPEFLWIIQRLFVYDILHSRSSHRGYEVFRNVDRLLRLDFRREA